VKNLWLVLLRIALVRLVMLRVVVVLEVVLSSASAARKDRRPLRVRGYEAAARAWP
jgi:hypothetical protein